MRKLRLKFALIIVPILLLSLNSCYTDYGLSTQDYDIVATFFNKSTDFKQFQTYTLIDSVVRVRDDGGSTSNPDTRYDQQILNRVAQNLEDYGYTPIPPDQVDPEQVGEEEPAEGEEHQHVEGDGVGDEEERVDRGVGELGEDDAQQREHGPGEPASDCQRLRKARHCSTNSRRSRCGTLCGSSFGTCVGTRSSSVNPNASPAPGDRSVLPPRHTALRERS